MSEVDPLLVRIGPDGAERVKAFAKSLSDAVNEVDTCDEIDLEHYLDGAGDA